jgi:hypothetical protein
VSSQQPYFDEMTPRQLFSWAQTNIQNMNFEFITDLEEEKLLLKRNLAAKPIHGPHKLHAFLPSMKK